MLIRMSETKKSQSFMAQVGRRLASLREMAGLSVLESSRRAQVSPRTWHRWESGRAAPTVDALYRALTAVSSQPAEAARYLLMEPGLEEPVQQALPGVE